MNRRKFSRRALLALTATSWGTSAGTGLAQDKRLAPAQWTNWSGSVKCTPRKMASPENEQQVVELLAEAHRDRAPVRVSASGHSFVPLCASDGALLSLDGLTGMLSANRAKSTATFRAGTKIHQMGEPLLKAGLAMENMGDIDRQGIAGAMSTGTHGTGKGIGSISTQVVGLRLVTARGEALECSAELRSDIFRAAQVSLGALGIITEVTLRCLPAFRLHEKVWQVPFAECSSKLNDLITGNRHFEFFWLPQGDVCWMKSLNPTDAAPNELPDRKGERIGHSYQIFPSVRNHKFNEIEFAVPERNGPDCLKELRELMRTKHRNVRWPLEYRTLAADNILLSPAQGRDSVTISAHQDSKLPYQAFFADVEAIFRNHRGRPHWGKIHTHTARELSRLYPYWEQFQSIRRQLDPQGRFLNGFLRRTFV